MEKDERSWWKMQLTIPKPYLHITMSLDNLLHKLHNLLLASVKSFGSPVAADACVVEPAADAPV